MITNYLKILEESLLKKIDVLQKIQDVNDAQSQLLRQEPVDMESFDQCVDEKDLYISQLSELDEGFETLYDNIKKELVGNKDRYADQIKRLQALISEITDRSVAIQAKEQRNKTLVEDFFKKEKNSLGQVRRNTKAAYGYYQNMSQSANPASYFLDHKK